MTCREISNTGGDEIFLTCPDRSGTNTASRTTGTGSFPEVNYGRGVTLTSHRLLVPWSRKSRTTLLLPYGTYGLKRASEPVECSNYSNPPVNRTACTKPLCLYSTGITLLPIWTVQSVQSLSACTVEINFNSPMGRTNLQSFRACTV